MKRLTDITVKIRDCQIANLKIDWCNNTNVEIIFKKGNSKFRLVLVEVQILDILENEFEPYQISHIKCLRGNDNWIWISLDPFDERIDEIEERDKFKMKFKTYSFEIIDI